MGKVVLVSNMRKILPPIMIAGFIVLILASLVGGIWFYRVQEKETYDNAAQKLTNIAHLKVQEIENWRLERTGDANVLMQNTFFIQEIENWLTEPEIKSLSGIKAYMESMYQNYRYNDVLFVDTSGNTQIGLKGSANLSSPERLEALQQALSEHRVMITDLYRDTDGEYVYIDVIAPLFGTQNGAQPLGAIILNVDADEFLYPLIQTWPGSSPTAETLLIRRDDDSVLFLNELRHINDTALRLSIPLTQTDVPAVMAMMGQTGLVEGLDYRGVPVLAYIEPIHNSNWYMISKVDWADAFAEWRFRSTMILILIPGLIVVCSAFFLMLAQRYRNTQVLKLLEAETALRQSQVAHKTTLMSVGDGVIATDLKGCVVLMNPVAEILTGWMEKEALGKPLEEVFKIVNEETLAAVENPVNRVLEQGRIVGLANHTLLIHRNGNKTPIADSAAPIQDKSNPMSGVVLVFRDQTEEREAVQAIQKSQEQYEQLFEEMLTGFSVQQIICDENGEPIDYRFVRMNREFEKHTGLKKEEVMNKTVREVLPDIEESHIKIYGNVALTGEPVSFEDYSTAIGKYFEYRVFCPEPGYFAAIFMDISERVRADKMRQEYAERLESEVEERTRQLEAAQEKLVRQEKLAILGQLAGGVGHELRNPLGVLSNAVYFLKLVQPDANDKVKEYLHIMESEIKTAEKIVSDLLDFSRIKSIDRQLTDPQALIDEALHRYPVPERVQVKTEIEPNLPQVYVDPRQMVQVLGNMITNAQQAMPDGGELTLNASHSQDRVAISVRDTGIGIAPENLEKLFEPLFTTKARGIGLGLSVCKNLVEANQGTIQVESKPGEGSCFTVLLPIAQR